MNIFKQLSLLALFSVGYPLSGHAQSVDVEQLKIDLESVQLPFKTSDGSIEMRAVAADHIAYPSYGAFFILRAQDATLITPNALILDPPVCQFDVSHNKEAIYLSQYGGSLTLKQSQYSASGGVTYSWRFSNKSTEQACQSLAQSYQQTMSESDAEQLNLQLLQISQDLVQAMLFVKEHSSKEHEQQQNRMLSRSHVQVLKLQNQLWKQFPQLLPEPLGGDYQVGTDQSKPMFNQCTKDEE
ncbi:hypothetical protein [Vibrio hippocampi]|uniref:DUF2884 family protein n=1 Tax=Vibrio hippocampi TaxID=654686 RepID=A0ABN8DMM1_9VIBR|nr:hypothetical protein [Vibrio hippocampi]CAH0528917.1 hypothetical protein VHP8226_02947 [Vibrio hippocampi]